MISEKESGFDILKIPIEIFDKLGARGKIMIDLKKEPTLIKKGEVAIFKKLIEKSKKHQRLIKVLANLKNLTNKTQKPKSPYFYRSTRKIDSDQDFDFLSLYKTT